MKRLTHLQRHALYGIRRAIRERRIASIFTQESAEFVTWMSSATFDSLVRRELLDPTLGLVPHYQLSTAAHEFFAHEERKARAS